MNDFIPGYFVSMIDKDFFYVPRNFVVIKSEEDDLYEVRIKPEEVRIFDEAWQKGLLHYGGDGDESLIYTSFRVYELRVATSETADISKLCFEGNLDRAKTMACYLYRAVEKAFDKDENA